MFVSYLDQNTQEFIDIYHISVKHTTHVVSVWRVSEDFPVGLWSVRNRPEGCRPSSMVLDRKHLDITFKYPRQ